MPDTASIVIVQKGTYRGVREETSNKYHFSGTTPANLAAWKTLADAFAAGHRSFMPAGNFVVRAYGYEPGNELSVAQIDYEAAPLTPLEGTATAGAVDIKAQPESAITVRWRTPERNSRKKWIYCRKYYHWVFANIGGDGIGPSSFNPINNWATKLTDGSLPGGVKYCGPQGAVLGAATVMPYMTTRELTRRGKRPSS